jgi:hypothetical protein
LPRAPAATCSMIALQRVSTHTSSMWMCIERRSYCRPRFHVHAAASYPDDERRAVGFPIPYQPKLYRLAFVLGRVAHTLVDSAWLQT